MDNSNLVVVLTCRWPFKIYRGLTLYVKGLVCRFPHKEKNYQIFLCLNSLKRIKPVDSAQQSKKNETFPTFVGHFNPGKSDFRICVELFCVCALGFSLKLIWL